MSYVERKCCRKFLQKTLCNWLQNIKNVAFALKWAQQTHQYFSANIVQLFVWCTYSTMYCTLYTIELLYLKKTFIVENTEMYSHQGIKSPIWIHIRLRYLYHKRRKDCRYISSRFKITNLFTLLLFPRLVQITYQQTQNWQPAKHKGENRVLKNHQLLHGNLLFDSTSELQVRILFLYSIYPTLKEKIYNRF